MTDSSSNRAGNVGTQQSAGTHEGGYGEGAPPGMSAYLFVDTFAVEKLSAQPECRLGRRNATIHGYETYIIEQWACERQLNTVVASYTGNSQHVVEVQILYVPTKLEKWSQLTFAHFEELVRMHILPKETPLGNMLVTSLSSLPSNLSLVPMPPRFTEGRLWFIVNKNLRRLNVVGRVATTADMPSDSVMANFRRSYSTSSVVPAGYAVKELVTLMQISLVYFELLNPEYVDGFLCDYTLRGLSSWWNSFGKQRYRTTPPRPTDKLYMRTSCAALVGAVTGARQRLSALGLKPPKDPFDAENFVECIKRFQKLEKLPRSKRLDDKTYFKLVHETTKISSLGGTKVLTVMKSTVKEGLSGKSNGGVENWETLDLEVLAANARGRRSQYLWQGKGSQCVPHTNPQFPIENVGPNTGIPQFSLTQEGLDDSGRHSHSSHHSYTDHPHHSHGPRRQHHQNNLSVELKNEPPQPEERVVEILEGQHKGSVDSSASALSNGSHEKMPSSKLTEDPPPGLLEVSATEPSTSFVNQFIKKQQQQDGLGEPFDDTKSHNRALSASSDHWFATRVNSPPKPPPTPRAPAEPRGETALESLNNAATKKAANVKKSPEELTTPAKLFTRDDFFAQQLHERPHLRRTSSLGAIENVVFPWDSLCALPKLAMLYQEARCLKQQLLVRFDKEREINRLLNQDVKENDQLLSTAQRNNVLIRYQVSASTKKEETVRRRVRELEAFMARLDYELATLRVKLKDVEQSVMVFSTKVDGIEAKWTQANEVQEKPWYTRWLKLWWG